MERNHWKIVSLPLFTHFCPLHKIMRKFPFLSLLVFSIGFACSPLLAQNDAGVTDDVSGESEVSNSEDSTSSNSSHDGKKGKATSKKKASVLGSLSEMDVFNAEPNKKAKFFIYLQSASWCPPCRKEMPKIVEMYPEMKKAKVEIILIGCDRDKESAQKYLQTFKAPFPGVMLKEGKDLPGFVKTQGIPHAAFVNSKGQLIEEAFATSGIIERWKEVIKQKPQKKSKNEK